jgi:hypothetical protein
MESLDAMAQDAGGGCISADLGFTPDTPASLRITTIEFLLMQEGWRLKQLQNNEPVFDRPVEFLSAPIRTFPQLKTRLALPLSSVYIGNSALLVPGEGSTLALTAPKGMILATTPPSEPKHVTDGEVSLIDQLYSINSVDIDAVSPLARFEPIRSVLDLTKGDLPGYILGLVALLLVAIFRDKMMAGLARLIGLERRKSDQPSEKQDSGKPSAVPVQRQGERIRIRQRPYRPRKPRGHT